MTVEYVGWEPYLEDPRLADPYGDEVGDDELLPPDEPDADDDWQDDDEAAARNA